jgi:hypothetical protein
LRGFASAGCGGMGHARRSVGDRRGPGRGPLRHSLFLVCGPCVVPQRPGFPGHERSVHQIGGLQPVRLGDAGRGRTLPSGSYRQIWDPCARCRSRRCPRARRRPSDFVCGMCRAVGHAPTRGLAFGGTPSHAEPAGKAFAGPVSVISIHSRCFWLLGRCRPAEVRGGPRFTGQCLRLRWLVRRGGPGGRSSLMFFRFRRVLVLP